MVYVIVEIAETSRVLEYLEKLCITDHPCCGYVHGIINN